jgi:hypothetical protein
MAAVLPYAGHEEPDDLFIGGGRRAADARAYRWPVAGWLRGEIPGRGAHEQPRLPQIAAFVSRRMAVDATCHAGHDVTAALDLIGGFASALACGGRSSLPFESRASRRPSGW